MYELDAIVDAWVEAEQRDEGAILATVVDVKGSAYRRPGARMLMTEKGHRVGSISGGCLEGDVVKKAWWWTESGHPVVRTFDSTADEEAAWEFGLGCNGVVRVLLERVGGPESASLKTFLAECREHRTQCVDATVISAPAESAMQVGARMFTFPDGSVRGSIPELDDVIRADMEAAGTAGKSRLSSYETAYGTVEVFIEVIVPPLPLLVFGAGHDAIPVVQIGKLLGWHVSVFDTRPAYVNHSRLAAADRLVLTRPDHVFGGADVDSRSAAVVMNHSYPLDRFILRELLKLRLRYIGVLGPRARTEKMLADLKIESWPPNLYAPIGLDIGAETPEAIALAIAAEVQTVISGREAGSLRKRSASIYAPGAAREVVA